MGIAKEFSCLEASGLQAETEAIKSRNSQGHGFFFGFLLTDRGFWDSLWGNTPAGVPHSLQEETDRNAHRSFLPRTRVNYRPSWKNGPRKNPAKRHCPSRLILVKAKGGWRYWGTTIEEKTSQYSQKKQRGKSDGLMGRAVPFTDAPKGGVGKKIKSGGAV